MNNFTKEQLLNIIAAADEVFTALAGTNEDLHRDDDARMCAAWDNLNDKVAPPEVVKQLAQSALAALNTEPVAWEVKGILCHTKEEADKYVGTPVPLIESFIDNTAQQYEALAKED